MKNKQSDNQHNIDNRPRELRQVVCGEGPELRLRRARDALQ